MRHYNDQIKQRAVESHINLCMKLHSNCNYIKGTVRSFVGPNNQIQTLEFYLFRITLHCYWPNFF